MLLPILALGTEILQIIGSCCIPFGPPLLNDVAILAVVGFGNSAIANNTPLWKIHFVLKVVSLITKFIPIFPGCILECETAHCTKTKRVGGSLVVSNLDESMDSGSNNRLLPTTFGVEDPNLEPNEPLLKIDQPPLIWPWSSVN